MLPTFDYDNAAKMADDDVIRGAVPDDVGDCQCQGRAMGDVYLRGRRRRRALVQVGSGRPFMTPDGTVVTGRRMHGGVAVAGAARTIGLTSTETMSTADALPSDRTLLTGDDDFTCGASHPLLNVRLTDTIWPSGDVGNSILRRSVSVVLHCRRRQYARSRRRLSISCGGGARAGGLAASMAASLLAAVLLVGTVAADPRRLHGESSHTAATHNRQLSPPDSGKGSSRRSQSDDVGAGTPCIYEGHIKTDR